MKAGSLDVPRDRIAAFCKRWQVAELSVFGSALAGELRLDCARRFSISIFSRSTAPHSHSRRRKNTTSPTPSAVQTTQKAG